MHLKLQLYAFCLLYTCRSHPKQEYTCFPKNAQLSINTEYKIWQNTMKFTFRVDENGPNLSST